MLGRTVLVAFGSLLLAACSDDAAAPAQRTIELVPRDPSAGRWPPGDIDLDGGSDLQLLPPATEEPRAVNL